MSENTPRVPDSRLVAVKQWLRKWNKSDVEDAAAHAIADAVSSGTDEVLKALATIDIVVRSSKRNEFERRTLPALKQALSASVSTTRSHISKTVAAPQKKSSPEAVPGPGYPKGNRTWETGVPREQAEEAFQELDLDSLYNTCRDLSDFEPPRRPIDVVMRNASDAQKDQGSFQAGYNFILRQKSESKRFSMEPGIFSSFHTLGINHKFLESEPDEARGVMIHEFGHLWTQRILGAFPGRTYAIQEAFAELFRSAAALRDGERWMQAHGCNGYQVLYGDKEPKLMPMREGDVPRDVGHASRYLACNRIIELLGGLGERQLHGIAKACALPAYPHNAEPLEHILRDIERETETPGFTDNFLNDPVLKPGNMKPGLTVIAFPNAAGNCCKIGCFEITDTAPLYGQSKQTYDQFPDGAMDVNSNTFHFNPARATNPHFTATITHLKHGIQMRLPATGELNLSPKTMIELAIQGNTSWPEGDYRVTFQLDGRESVEVQQTLNISRAERLYWCKKLGIPVIDKK